MMYDSGNPGPLNELIRAVLHYVANETDDPHAYYDAQLEYDAERILEAAKALVKQRTENAGE